MGVVQDMRKASWVQGVSSKRRAQGAPSEPAAPAVLASAPMSICVEATM